MLGVEFLLFFLYHSRSALSYFADLFTIFRLDLSLTSNPVAEDELAS